MIDEKLRVESGQSLIANPIEKNDQKRFLGLEEVKNNLHLLIYGDAGAGKTLFLKWLAIRYLQPKASQEDFGNEYLPILIRFKHLSEDIVESNLVKVAIDRFESIPDSASVIQEKLEKGQCIVLLDAVDESGVNIDYICEKIDRFVEIYPNNRIIITCREAATDHKFEGFTEVEMASFDSEQVSSFVSNWFNASKIDVEYSGDTKAGEKALKELRGKFLSDLESDPLTRELTSRPLLLTYLCLVFRENFGFPKCRSSIFADVVDILLRRWDSSRQVKRRSTSEQNKLSSVQKVLLLGEIAYEGLKRSSKQFIWKESQLLEQIRPYLLKVAALDEKDISVNTKEILDIIVRDGGLLFETARGLYAFPYTALQEYLAAEYIVRKSSVDSNLIPQTVEKYFTNYQWHQVFLMIFERLPDADELFKIVFYRVNSLVRSKALQAMLTWLNEITTSCGVGNCGWRSMALTIDIYTSLFLDIKEVEPIRRYAEDLSISIHKYNKERKAAIPNTPKARLVFDHLSVLLKLADEISNPIGIQLLEANDYIISRLRLNDILANQKKNNESTTEIVVRIIKEKLRLSIELTITANIPILEKELIALSNCIPSDVKSSEFSKWTEYLRNLLNKNLSIGFKNNLSNDDYDSLNKYIYSVNLLLKCILGDNMSETWLRNEITDHILLPESLNANEDLLPSFLAIRNSK